MKKPSDKGRLVRKYLERKPASDFRVALGKKDRERGIYVLYNGTEVYYIGLSKSSLRYRLRKHAKDIEFLLLRVFAPEGNNQSDRFKRMNDLSWRLHEE